LAINILNLCRLFNQNGIRVDPDLIHFDFHTPLFELTSSNIFQTAAGELQVPALL
jgi:hypothetical protein